MATQVNAARQQWADEKAEMEKKMAEMQSELDAAYKMKAAHDRAEELRSRGALWAVVHSVY